EIHGDVDARRTQVPFERADEFPVALVDRRHAPEVQIVFRYRLEAFLGHIAPAGDVPQEREYLVRTFRPAEGCEHDCLRAAPDRPGVLAHGGNVSRSWHGSRRRRRPPTPSCRAASPTARCTP